MNRRPLLTKYLRPAGIIIIILTLIAALCVLIGIDRKRKTTQKNDFALNTFISIIIYGHDPQREAGEKKTNEELITQAMRMIHEYETVFSATDTGSELYRLNNRQLEKIPGKDDVFIISGELAHVIETGTGFAEKTEGAFDITIKPVKDLWSFSSEDHALPDPGDISKALVNVGWKRIQVIASENGLYAVKLPEGMQIDLGAIAKGYIADRVKEYLVREGVKSAIINLGGNVLCIGHNTDGKPFMIGLKKPFAESEEVYDKIPADDMSVVTSGVYERSFVKDGKRYHHILDPQTGYPCDNGVVSVSILYNDSEIADAASTACLCIGSNRAATLVEAFPGMKAYFVMEDKSIVHVGE